MVRDDFFSSPISELVFGERDLDLEGQIGWDQYRYCSISDWGRGSDWCGFCAHLRGSTGGWIEWVVVWRSQSYDTSKTATLTPCVIYKTYTLSLRIPQILLRQTPLATASALDKEVTLSSESNYFPGRGRS